MDESAIYKKQGMGNALGFGKKAALVVVDFVNGFNDRRSLAGAIFLMPSKRPRGCSKPPDATTCPWLSRGSSIRRTAATQASLPKRHPN